MSGLPVLKLARHAMATRFELVLYGVDVDRLRAAGEEALDEIERLEAQLSFYRTESELSGINARADRAAVTVEPRLFELLWQAAALSAATGGAFDLTIAPLMRLWGLAGGQGHLPSPDELEAALGRTGMVHVRLDEKHSSIRFERERMQLDLGAIGKGFAIDAAIGLLREAGVESALLHGGTSTAFGLGAPPGESAWRVALRHPLEEDDHLGVVCLQDEALSVSAGHGKSFRHEGRTYGHVLDPRNGWPVDRHLLAAVAGPSATATDALSTALLVLGEAGLACVTAWDSAYEGLVAGLDERASLRISATGARERWGSETGHPAPRSEY